MSKSKRKSPSGGSIRIKSYSRNGWLSVQADEQSGLVEVIILYMFGIQRASFASPQHFNQHRSNVGITVSNSILDYLNRFLNYLISEGEVAVVIVAMLWQRGTSSIAELNNMDGLQLGSFKLQVLIVLVDSDVFLTTRATIIVRPASCG